MQLALREFQRKDNVEYASWFSHPEIDKHIGPPWSGEELDEIFKENPMSVYSAFYSTELVGVISIAFPDQEYSSYGITGVAVKPNLQRQGFGAKIITATQNYLNTQPGQEWMAFVSINNESAQQFMEKQGWKKGGIENKMYLYMYIQCA